MRRRVLVALVVLFALGVSLPVLAGGRPLSADLSWDNEVPPGTGTTETGSADITVNQGQEEICFDIQVSGLSAPLLADHIHVGVAGQNGPVVVSLQGALEGCVAADGDLIKAIRHNPAGYYVNLHTALNPGGEVRGQRSK